MPMTIKPLIKIKSRNRTSGSLTPRFFKCHAPAVKILAVNSSTNKCWREIGCLQYRHRPKNTQKEIIGHKSKKPSTTLQTSQRERPRIVSLLASRSIKTFKKLPQNKPKMKTIIKYDIYLF